MTPLAVPRVSVLMTTYNGERTLADSVASILAQRMTDFELVVVDDASSDETRALLRGFTDTRLVVIRNETRLGIAEARNRGFSHCRAGYVAALDHDDLSDPNRLELQAAYLDAHPGVVLVGTAVQELRDRVVTPEDQPPRTTPALLRLLLHFDNPLAWSSVMLRADLLRRLAPSPLRRDFEPADDFDLYHRLLEWGDIARIDAPLTTYRWHASNASYGSKPMTERAVRVLTRAYTPWFGSDAAAAAALVVRHGNNRVAATDTATLARLHAIVRRVSAELAAAHPMDRPQIPAGVRQVLWRFTRASVRTGHPFLFRRPAPMLDAAVSLAVGAVRGGRRRLGRDAR